ncbi:MAG: SufD family Fe-S cluster assembly protein [Alistipes sp.]|nr:SufD family Fe-S cluster assembly protein [Alistipes sp.]
MQSIMQNGVAIPSDGKVGSGRWTLVLDHDTHIVVEGGSRAEIIIADADADVKLGVCVEPNASLSVVHAVTKSGNSSIEYKLGEGASCRVTEVVLNSSELNISARLDAPMANFELDGAFILTGDERGSVKVDVAHNVADCTSRTSFKGVASGRATGRFSGLVYVAPDAQRTSSEQSSRNVVIGDAHIDTLPQLEIYADDVKCSHGATVGQMDSEAVLYMRQRGLSLVDAKRLQIEGFVADVAMHSSISDTAERLNELISAKLETL